MPTSESRLLALQVELDLGFNAYANARAHYDKRKQHMVKQQKTVDANEKALKAAEKKAQQQLSQVRTKSAIQHVRKPHWFEKFNWFVTSENYLVISGRDAQQNELIVKRYLKKGQCCCSVYRGASESFPCLADSTYVVVTVQLKLGLQKHKDRILGMNTPRICTVFLSRTCSLCLRPHDDLHLNSYTTLNMRTRSAVCSMNLYITCCALKL